MTDLAPSPWVTAPSFGLATLVRRTLGTPLRLWRARDLGQTSLLRELRGRLAGTVLGPFWPLAQPLVLLLVYGFVFTTLLAQRLPGIPGDATFGYWLLVGVLVWSSMAESLARGTQALVEGRELVRKMAYPVELLPLVPILSTHLILLASLLLVALLAALLGIAPLHLQHLWIAPILLCQFLFLSGLCWILAGLNACLRDVGQALPLLLTALMLATPVFWVPDKTIVPGLTPYLPFVEASPFANLLLAWRAALLAGVEGFASTSPAPALTRLLPVACFTFLLGRLVLARLEPMILDEV